MCSCGAPFHPLQSVCGGGELTPEVIPDIWNSFFGCYPMDTAAARGLVPLAGWVSCKDKQELASRGKEGRIQTHKRGETGCSPFTSVGILFRCLALPTASVGSEMHHSSFSTSWGVTPAGTSRWIPVHPPSWEFSCALDKWESKEKRVCWFFGCFFWFVLLLLLFCLFGW